MTIPEGEFSVFIDIQANTTLAGTARITASNAAFAPDFTIVNVTAALNILESSQVFESTETEQLYFQVLSGEHHWQRQRAVSKSR